MFLLVGLGNPGPSYAGHRHNIGFMAVDAIARRYSLGSFQTRFQTLMIEGVVAGIHIIAVKPLTYMNNSGLAVSDIMHFYKVTLDRVVVFHDELDLPLGKVRVKNGGGNAGHNGLKSIDAYVGCGYRRVRLGIGHPGRSDHVVKYVLHNFDKTDCVWLKPLLEMIADSIPVLLSGNKVCFTSSLEEFYRMYFPLSM